MKKYYLKMLRIAIWLIAILFWLYHGTIAQCIAPSLQFKNPVVVAGTDKQVGAIYKFPNVTSSVDALIRIDSLVGGATLLNIDVTDFGYDYAWQPRVNGPAGPVGNKSYIRWTITFVEKGTRNPVILPCMSLDAIDIDGDGVGIREFIEAKFVNSYFNVKPSRLSCSQANACITALGSVENKKDIDTLAYDTNVQFNYNDVSSIHLLTGALVNNSGNNMSTERYNSLYFKNIEVASTLPVRLLDFSGRFIGESKIKLNWVTELEVNNKLFEIQRSFDGREFGTVGKLFSREGTGAKAYEFTDEIPIGQRGRVYYRIKQIDIDNKYSLTKIITVNVLEPGNVFVRVVPNPVINDLNIVIQNPTSSPANIRILDLSGRELYRKNLRDYTGSAFEIDTRTANMRVPGLYVGEILFEDGSRITKKLIKR